MNNKTVFVRTAKGDAEANGETSLLFGEAKRVFVLINNKYTVDEMRKHAAPSLRPDLDSILQQLEADDFIRDKNAKAAPKPVSSGVMPKIAQPPKMATPPKISQPGGQGEEEDELDFTSGQHPIVDDTGAPAGGGGLDFSKPAAPKPAAAPAPKAAPPEIDFSSLVSGSAPAEQKPAATPAAPQKPAPAAPAQKPAAAPEEKKAAEPEIDFSSILSEAGAAAAKAKVDEEAKAKADAEAKAKEMEAAKAKMRAELEAKMRAENEAREKAAEEAHARSAAAAKAQADARLKEEAEARARAEAKAKEEADARARAEAKARQEAEARARADAEAKAKAEAEAKARAEAAAMQRAEAEAKARAQAEAKAKAEAEAKQRAQAEARAKAEAQAKARAEAEAKAKAEAEKAQQPASFDELDFSSILGGGDTAPPPEAPAPAREAPAPAADAKAKGEADARARLTAELEASMRDTQPADVRTSSGRQQGRSMIATVLFFDVVGYTKQSVSRQIELKDQFNSLISGMLGHVDEEHRIILDTGDGAAIGFLQHPEDALDVAVKFRAAVTANNHRDYPDLKVRAGIHLGPVNVMKDMNGQLNMVGDGINDAQRIMSFAGVDQIYVSRAYFDVISRLTADSARLFKYYGTQKDKHGREHQVYQVLGDGAAVPGRAAPQSAGGVESLLQDLSSMLQGEPTAPPSQPAGQPEAAGEWQAAEIPGASADAQREQQEAAAKAAKIAEQEAAAKAAKMAEQEARVNAQQEAARAKAEEKAAKARAAEEEAERQRQEEAARKLAADQAKAFAEAEKRARKAAEAEEKAKQKEAKVRAKEEKKKAKLEAAAAAKAAKAAKQRASAQKSPTAAARPARGSHGFPLFKVIFVLILLAVGAVVGLPNIYPMQEYIPRVEGEMSQVLGQPVHIGGIKVATVPVPKIDLTGVSIGKGQQLKIGRVSLLPNLLSLATSRRKLDKVELTDVSVDANSFMAVLPWLRMAGSIDKYPVVRMDLRGVHITGGGTVPVFGGRIDFDQYGQYSRARFSVGGGRYQVELTPKDKDHAQIDVEVEDSALPLISAIEFSSLQMTGEIGGDGATFSNVSGTLYGGSLKGVATLSWRNGWQLQGNVAVHSVLMEKALPGMKISGDMDGSASFLTSGPDLAQLVRTRRLDGAFSMRDGQVGGLDIAETLRGDRRHAVPGNTHFDVLTGTVHVDSNGQHVRPIRVTSGRMTVSGSVDTSNEGQLAGHFKVDTSRLRAGLGTLSLRLGGTVAEPEWSVGR